MEREFVGDRDGMGARLGRIDGADARTRQGSFDVWFIDFLLGASRKHPA